MLAKGLAIEVGFTTTGRLIAVVIIVLELRIVVGIPTVKTVVWVETEVLAETLGTSTDEVREVGTLMTGRVMVVGMVTLELPIRVGTPTVITEV